MSDEDNEGWAGVVDAMRDWWWVLQPSRPNGDPNPKGDRGVVARLKRATTVAEAMAEQATVDLYFRLPITFQKKHLLPRVAVVAHVLAFIREDEQSKNVMRTLGRKTSDAKDNDTAKLKPLRFRRLLAAREDEELMREMRRLVAVADRNKLNVGDLGASMLFWSDRIRTNWAFDYHAAGMAAPRAANVAA